MKTIFILSIILLTTNLFGRINPFEPTTAYVTEQKSYTDKIKKQKKLEQQQKLEAELKKIEQENIILEDKEILEPVKITTKAKPKKSNYVKDNFQPLSFVTLYTIQNNLMIEIDKKYTFINKRILDEQNKILFDFKGNESFYTIRQELKNPNYKSFAIGTHQKENFFRVVVDLTGMTKNYKSTVDKKNNIIILQPLKR